MRNNRLNVAVIAGVCIFLIVIISVSIISGSNIKEDEKTGKVVLNSSERKYAAQNPEINVYICEEVSYLSEGNGREYLDEYLDIILAKAGMTDRIVDDEKDADCSIHVVTESVREQSDAISFTAPVFQVKGKLYRKETSADRSVYSGVAMAERMEAAELNKIKYNDSSIRWQTVKTAEEAVKTAEKENADFVLGDEPGIDKALGDNSGYVGLKSDMYGYNVCIVTDKKERILSDIINQCIHGMDRKTVTYELSQKYLHGGRLLFMEKDYADLYLMVLIVFVAIFIAFFIYYLTNKNLYAELSERMILLAESKKELQTTMGSIGHYMAELSRDGSIIDINSAFYSFLGEHFTGRKVWDVLKLNEEDRLLLERGILSMEEEGPVNDMEMKSENRILEINVHPIENARGGVDKLLFMANDVTNVRMAERQMRQDNKMIAVGQLAAGVAHEIRNPLGIIRNYCYVLKNIDDAELRKKAVEQIEKSVDASGKIVDSLLHFSRVSNAMKVNINIKKHVEGLLLLNHSLLKSKSIKTNVICPEEVRSTLNEESFDMVIVNLISNAVAAMDEEGVLTIDILRRGSEFEVAVADTGCGISEENIDEIFNPFFTTKGDSGGTGLGLYIVYNELSKMGGRITVKSEVGRGTRFVVTLPVEE